MSTSCRVSYRTQAGERRTEAVQFDRLMLWCRDLNRRGGRVEANHRTPSLAGGAWRELVLVGGAQ